MAPPSQRQQQPQREKRPQRQQQVRLPQRENPEAPFALSEAKGLMNQRRQTLRFAQGERICGGYRRRPVP